MPDIGPLELLLILAVILLLFGGAKLPELARSLGRAKKEFQEGATETPTKGATEAPKKEASDT
jgi:sec-independent protein translocase protein TatA